MPKMVVDTSELKAIRESIDNILKNKNWNVTENTQQPSNITLSEREKLIMGYLEQNPATTKEGVIKYVHDLGKGARMSTIKSIRGLAKEGLISIRKDEHNSQTHRLFVNKENALVTLIQDLDFFKQAYSKLIDKTKGKYIQLNHSMNVLIKEGKDPIDLFDKVCDLHESMLLPYSFIIMKYNFSDLFSMPEHSANKEFIQRKFAIIYQTIQEIHLKIYELMPRLPSSYTESWLMQTLWNSPHGLTPENISHMLKIFREYDLSNYAEIVIDSLWKISYYILPTMHRTYSELRGKEGLKYWRDIVNDYELEEIAHNEQKQEEDPDTEEEYIS